MQNPPQSPQPVPSAHDALRAFPTRARIEAIASWTIVAMIVPLFYLKYEQIDPGRNPDKWYHFAIARLMATEMVLHRVPGIEDLGWDRTFADKEFFFHVLAGAAWRVGGDDGVRTLCVLLGSAVAVGTFVIARRAVRPSVAAGLVVTVFVGTPYFTDRITQERPHVLAMLAALSLLASLLAGRRVAAFGAAFLFCFSYHAFYVPLLIVLAFIAFSPPGVLRVRLATAVIVGVVAGLVANPTFPGSLALGVEHLGFALQPEVPPGIVVGGELVAWPFRQIATGLPSVLALASCVLLTFRLVRQQDDPALGFLGAVAVGFSVLCIRSPRASEYAVPFVVIAASHAAAAWGARRSTSRAFRLARAAVAAFLVVVAGWRVRDLATSVPRDFHAAVTADLFDALAAIPADRAYKVYNQDWLIGEFGIYKRPDLRFVDLLDPRLLRAVEPGLFELRRHLTLRDVVDPYTAIRSAFRADYVLTMDAGFAAWIAQDPRFIRIPTPDRARAVALFALTSPPTSGR